jgi:signal transduction histidine kinase
MPLKSIAFSKKQQKIVWVIGLFLGWGLAFSMETDRLPLAYGSFLLWAVSAGFIWGRRAPFLSVGIFIVGAASLSWDVLSTETWQWFSSEGGLWILLIFLSTLSSSFWTRLQLEQARIHTLEHGLLHAARWTVWGRMTASMGHELRNQIAIVTGYLDQLKDEDLAPAHLRKIERSLLANDRMLKLLTQFRLMTRDSLHEPLQALALPEVLHDTLEFLESPLQYRAIAVSWKANPDLPRAMAHPALLKTLLAHLVLHSLEVFKGQESLDEKAICIEIESQGEAICLHYRDNCQHPKLWDDAGQILAEQLILQQGGSLEQRLILSTGWEVFLYFKTAQSAAADRDQEALAAS